METGAGGRGSSGPGVAPRWEWRALGEEVAAAESRFAELALERSLERDETYVLSRHADASVKARDGSIDVKRLERVSAEGLELWRPALNAAFPLGALEVRTLFEALGVPVPPLSRPSYSLEQLLDELVRPSPDLLVAEVRKSRRLYTVGGCRAELTVMRTERGETKTVAVESEEAELVLPVVRELGLGSLPNVNVPRGLKTLLGFGAARFAAIDVGTNSVKLHVGERRADGSWLGVVDRVVVTRLGEALAETGRLGDAPIERTAAAVAELVEEARREGAASIAAVGTAGLRMAPNRDAFVDAVRARCGIEVEVISGEEEARLAYLAVVAGLGVGAASAVVFDTGGGSSQFTFGRGGRVVERFSVDVGAVRFTERYGLEGRVADDALEAALAAIAAGLARLDGRPAPDALVAIGGAVTNLAAVKLGLEAYDPDAVQGTVLDRGELDRQLERYRSSTLEERRAIVGLDPARADVILAGACIVRTVVEKLGRDSLVVSDRGLRHGLLVDRFGS